MNMAKGWIIAAVALIFVGLIVFVVAMTFNKWDFSALSTVKYQPKTYDIQEDFNKISIDVMIDNVEFVPSADESCHVECEEAEKIKHTATVVDGTLVIDTEDTRKWYEHIGIFSYTPKLIVYLPKTEYLSINVNTNTGSIKIPSGFTIESINLTGDTGSVECSANVTKNIKIEVDTGHIKIDGCKPENITLSADTGHIDLHSVMATGTISVTTDTGGIYLGEVRAKDCNLESDTGKITLVNTIASGSFAIKNSTGSVIFEDSDAAEIYVRTSTGSVRGTLLSEKIFITKTSTGRVEVPASTTGGRCEITTDTGSIKISIK